MELIRALGNFNLGGRSHRTGDVAFTSATSRDSQHSRANTESHNSHNAQHIKKQNSLYFMQQNTQPS